MTNLILSKQWCRMKTTWQSWPARGYTCKQLFSLNPMAGHTMAVDGRPKTQFASTAQLKLNNMEHGNVFTHLPQGSYFLYHFFNIHMILFVVVIIALLHQHLIADWHVRLQEDGLCSSDVAAAVWAGLASWLLLDEYQQPIIGRGKENVHVNVKKHPFSSAD